MGVLESTNGRRVSLRPTHLIGRSSRCDLVLEDPRCSGHHANLRWTPEGWECADLGSRNGTWVDGERLGPGQRVRVQAGGQLHFGAAEQAWTLSSAAPPAPAALREDGVERVGSRGLLLLDEGEPHPPLSIFRDADGAWVAEPELGPVRDGDRLEHGGHVWTLSLPDEVALTAEATDAPHISELSLTFEVSRDEEFVQLRGAWRGGELDLGSRSHNYLLLTLARLRLEDQAEGLPAAEQGWVDLERLEGMLRTPERLINLHVFRARKAFDEAKIEDAAGIVERRSYVKQLRLGVPFVEVRPL